MVPHIFIASQEKHPSPTHIYTHTHIYENELICNHLLYDQCSQRNVYLIIGSCIRLVAWPCFITCAVMRLSIFLLLLLCIAFPLHVTSHSNEGMFYSILFEFSHKYLFIYFKLLEFVK